jgi:spore maturation protein CgeB
VTRKKADAADGATRPEDPRADALLEKTERLSEDLRAAKADLADARRERDRAREELARVRRRRAVRVATAAADGGRNLVDRARNLRSGLARLTTSVVVGTGIAAPAGYHRLRASAGRLATLQDAIAASLPAGGLSSGPTVSVVIRRGDGSGETEAAVRASTYADLGVTTIEDSPQALTDALAGATGEFVLLLHDDVRPVDRSAIGRLVQTLRDAPPDVAAVGARLILPRRQGPAVGPVSEAPDLTVGHLGLSFEPENGIHRPVQIGRGGDPLDPSAAAVAEVPAASGACLLVRRSSVLALGTTEATSDRPPGMDGVELCLRLRGDGQRILVDGGAAFWHDETAALDHLEMPEGWGPSLFRSVFSDRLEGTGSWSRGPFHLAITVTSNDPTAGFGDWYTAHELGDELEAIGWRVTYVERRDERWYDLMPDVDAILVLIDLYDLRRIPRGIVRIAWVRSWTEHWLARPWFDDFDLVLTTSRASKESIDRDSSSCSVLFPLATNPKRFARVHGEADGGADDASDVAFVGSYFGEPRDIASGLLALHHDGRTVRVWGNGWHQIEGMAELTDGPLPYDNVADAYRAASLVIDDAVAGTREFGLMNSRVFDAIAVGTLVVTNNEIGARELFDDEFPTWTDPASLVKAVNGLLADPARRHDLAARYAAIVRERHTYDRRAQELKAHLGMWVERPRTAISIGARTWPEAERWGDLYFARGLQREFARRGMPTTVHVHGEWPTLGCRADVALHLFGARVPAVSDRQITLLWIISHPDLVTPELLEGYDRVFVASDRFATRVAAMTSVAVLPLHQATDPDRFWPDPTGPTHELLFIGSSRGQQRPVVSAAAASGHDLAVYGTGWTPDLLDPRHVRAEWIPNEQVRRYYSSAKVVLADHYDDMRDLGFISNRIYDALACGAFVLSDEVPGLDTEFDGGVVACDGPESVRAAIDRYVADAEIRNTVARRGQRAVLDRHTFAARIDAIQEIVGPLLDARGSRVGGARG